MKYLPYYSNIATSNIFPQWIKTTTTTLAYPWFYMCRPLMLVYCKVSILRITRSRLISMYIIGSLKKDALPMAVIAGIGKRIVGVK